MKYCPGCGKVSEGLLGHDHFVEPLELGVSISHGTLLPEHLIAAFEPVAQKVNSDKVAIARHWYDNQPGDSEDEVEYLLKLTEILEGAEIEGYSFGTLEGDGSDFGFWPNEPDDDSPCRLCLRADCRGFCI